MSYFAAIDAGFLHDDFALAIAHRRSDGTFVLDLLVSWRGSNKIAVCWKQVRSEIKYYCDRYRINAVVADQHYITIIEQDLLEIGLYVKEVTFGTHTRPEIFGTLKHLLRQCMAELLDIQEFLEELLNLEELTKNGGRITVQPAGTMRDDRTEVVALGFNEMCKQEGALPPPQLGIVVPSSKFHGYNPFACPVAAACVNIPYCMDVGSCQGFVDERLIAISRR